MKHCIQIIKDKSPWAGDRERLCGKIATNRVTLRGIALAEMDLCDIHAEDLEREFRRRPKVEVRITKIQKGGQYEL